MEPYRVRNVSDTRVGHTCGVFLSICDLFTCRVHFNIAMSVQQCTRASCMAYVDYTQFQHLEKLLITRKHDET